MQKSIILDRLHLYHRCLSIRWHGIMACSCPQSLYSLTVRHGKHAQDVHTERERRFLSLVCMSDSVRTRVHPTRPVHYHVSYRHASIVYHRCLQVEATVIEAGLRRGMGKSPMVQADAAGEFKVINPFLQARYTRARTLGMTVPASS